jgi:hypothetical protein
MEYNRGKIYLITTKNAVEGDVYIGSTIQTLSHRFGQHKDKYRKQIGKDGTTTTKLLFTKYGIDNCYIELIKLFPCSSKKELIDEEAKYIKERKCVNRYIPNRTKKQYIIDTKESKVEYDRKYREENKEMLKKKKSEYYHKNREKITQHHHDYYVNNKEQISQKEKEKGCCDKCGKEMRKDSIRRHKLICGN